MRLFVREDRLRGGGAIFIWQMGAVHGRPADRSGSDGGLPSECTT
jgi:hypothetical protein